MRTTLRLLATLAVVLPALVSAQNTPRTPRPAAARVAIFDSRVVFDSMPERSAVESEFALDQAKARTLVAAASDSLRMALDELVQVEQRLTPREREAGKLNLRARELLVEQMVENLDAVMQRRLNELREPLLRRIREAVRTVRARDGYHLVIDRASGGIEFDADDSLDITNAIAQELRRAQVERPAAGADVPPGGSLTRRGRG